MDQCGPHFVLLATVHASEFLCRVNMVAVFDLVALWSHKVQPQYCARTRLCTSAGFHCCRFEKADTQAQGSGMHTVDSRRGTVDSEVAADFAMDLPASITQPSTAASQRRLDRFDSLARGESSDGVRHSR